MCPYEYSSNNLFPTPSRPMINCGWSSTTPLETKIHCSPQQIINSRCGSMLYGPSVMCSWTAMALKWNVPVLIRGVCVLIDDWETCGHCFIIHLRGHAHWWPIPIMILRHAQQRWNMMNFFLCFLCSDVILNGRLGVFSWFRPLVARADVFFRINKLSK